MGGCFIINNNILQAKCDWVCAFVRGVLSHGNSVTRDEISRASAHPGEAYSLA
jgi:hypothetical protein